MAAINSGEGPFGPGLRRRLGAKSSLYFGFTSARWNLRIAAGSVVTYALRTLLTMKSKSMAPVIAAIVNVTAEVPVSAEPDIPPAICRPAKAPAIPTRMFLVKSSMPSVGVLALVAYPMRTPQTTVIMMIVITGLTLG